MENDADRAVPVQALVGSRLTNSELVDAIERADSHFSHSGTEKGKLWLCHLDALLKIQLERAANASALASVDSRKQVVGTVEGKEQ